MTSYRPVAPELASRITSAVTAQQQLRAARTPSHDDTGASQQEHESLLRQVEDILAEHKGALQGVAIEVLYITRTIVDAAGPREVLREPRCKRLRAAHARGPARAGPRARGGCDAASEPADALEMKPQSSQAPTSTPTLVREREPHERTEPPFKPSE